MHKIIKEMVLFSLVQYRERSWMRNISQEGQLEGDIHEEGRKCMLSWNTQGQSGALHIVVSQNTMYVGGKEVREKIMEKFINFFFWQ